MDDLTFALQGVDEYTVICRTCGEELGTVWREKGGPRGEPPWYAEHPDGEAAGFGPETTRRGAAGILWSTHDPHEVPRG